MHVFLDTNLFFNDTFWNNDYLKALLNKAKKREIKLFISKVVYEELKYHVINDYEDNIKRIGDLSKKLHFFNMENSDLDNLIKSFDAVDMSNLFESFYSFLESNRYLSILHYSENLVPRIVNQSLNDKIPFQKNKDGVRDYIIWLTYFDYVKKNNIKEAIFVTKNANDFCSGEPLYTNPNVFKTHKDLGDCDEVFSVYTSLSDFFRHKFPMPFEYNDRLGKWLHKASFSYSFLNELIFLYDFHGLGKKVKEYLNLPEPNLLFKNEVNVVDVEMLMLEESIVPIKMKGWMKCDNVEIESTLKLKPIIVGRRFEEERLIDLECSINAYVDVLITIDPTYEKFEGWIGQIINIKVLNVTVVN